MVQIEYLPIVLTGIGIIVSILYYTSVLRNANKTQQQQLDTRQAQLFMQMYNKWGDDLRESFNQIISMEYEDFSDFKENYGDETKSDMLKHISRMAYFLEGLGVLVKENLVSMRLVALNWAGSTRMFWDKISPIIDDWRKEVNYPRMWSETEYLCKRLNEYIVEHPELAT